METAAGFTMNRRREILWRCNKCKGVGLFRRLDGKVLNHVQSGRYAVRGFNSVNAGIRMEVGDTHALDDLPKVEDPDTIIIIDLYTLNMAYTCFQNSVL